MNHRLPFLAAPLLFLLASLAVPTRAESAGVDISIRYFDKRVYYVEDAPILVQVTLANNSPSTYRFKLADDRAFSVDFDVRSMKNRQVEQAEFLIRKRTSNDHVYFREISVQSGESFSFVEDIRRYADLSESGSFVVQAKLHPELVSLPATGVRNEVPPLESNRLNLNLLPVPVIVDASGLPLALDVETNAVLVLEDRSPDDIVGYTLTARQKSQWEKFFLYLDLESLVIRDAARSRQWRAESEEGRQRMIARYRGELRASVIDEDIVTIPMDFTIEQTSYGAEEGTVTALERFQTGNYIERKRYTYYLRRRDGVWKITDYTVLNLGTE